MTDTAKHNSPPRKRKRTVIREEGRGFVDLDEIPGEQRAAALTDAPWEAGWEFWRVSDFFENAVSFDSAEADEKILMKVLCKSVIKIGHCLLSIKGLLLLF